MAAAERALLSAVRRDSLDMVDTQSVPEKILMREQKLFFRGPGVLRRPVGDGMRLRF
jgi:hypothetical protein